MGPISIGESIEKSAVLIEALPYIQRFAGTTVVIKFGGNALSDGVGNSDEENLAAFAKDVVLLHAVGLKPVVVHGGGPQIDELLRRVGKEPVFKNGLRVTDAETLEVVRMVLLGKMNPDLVASVNLEGAPAVGVSGADGSMVLCQQADPELGFVGEITAVDPEIIERMLTDGFVPIVASIGVDAAGQAYNINADHMAAALASALKAEKLVYLTNIDGLMVDPAEPRSLIRQISGERLQDMFSGGTISGGMIPKVDSALGALHAGVRTVHFLDGRLAHALLLEVFTDSGIGTMIYA